ncbi:MAG: outer membrane beta-barrel protein [candidate division Zixibacteria bacterium]|nr:outer membrane beta-barrel protein [candidate division Zixibacteria bacterium]
MCKRLVLILVVIIMVPGQIFAQKAGSFIASIDIGLTAPVGDFSTDTTLKSESGFGFGGELRYALLNNLSLGPFFKYYRFGSSSQSSSGSISYNFVQYGGLIRLNVYNVNDGKLYIVGGGGAFKPNAHSWSREQIKNESFESDIFFTAGLGLCSNPYAKTIYEFEVLYNTGNADWNRITYEGEELNSNHNFDFIYLCMKISFNTGGETAPPRY